MTRRPLVMCTDLDRTLIPNGDALEPAGARERFARFVAQDHVTLVFVTGRDLALVQEAIATWDLPRPDAIVADVGASVWWIADEGAVRDAGWDEQLAPDWAPHGHEGLAEALGRVVGLTPQPADRQARHKLSYFVDASAPRESLDLDIAARLDALGVRARRIWSVDDAAGVGLLDVLPASASKLHALQHVLGCMDVDERDAVFAGDSGNDLEVLTSAIPAVLVANARQEVRRAARSGAAEAGTTAALRVARGPSACYVGGALEGVRAFRPDALAGVGPDQEA